MSNSITPRLARISLTIIFTLAAVSSYLLSLSPAHSQDSLYPQGTPSAFTQTDTAQQPTISTLEGTITNIADQKNIQVMGNDQLFQQLEILVTSQQHKGQTITVEHGGLAQVNVQPYQVGDKVQILASTIDGQTSYQISDYVRRTPLLLLSLVFVGLVLLVNLKKGIFSLISLSLTFVIIFAVVLPLILHGYNPVLIALAAALLMIPTTYFISHGFNNKTIIAALGTLISLTLAVILAQFFINAAQLTGYASDEAGFLQQLNQGSLNIKGLILAGIVLGLIGVLDDVTITQAGFIQQLKLAQPSITNKELYQRAMAVGRDHISSLVNTLILVYTSAAMPLLLLFTQTERPFMELINYEIVAEEIIRTLIVSIGIVISVPITTYLAAKTINWPLWQKPVFTKFSPQNDHHHH